MGDLKGAATALREAIRLDPSSPGPYNTLGQILRLQGDLSGSKTAFADGARARQRREAEQKLIFDRSRTETVGPARK
jgi:Flp pilus assembly protein TadD